jgi:integrase
MEEQVSKKSRRGFGAIRKLPSGRWQASYISPEGQRCLAPTTFGTKTDADVFLNGVRYEIERGLWNDPSSKEGAPKTANFKAFAEMHINLQVTRRGTSLRPSTKALYRKLLRNHLSDFFDLALNEIDKPMVDKWYVKTSSKGILTTASKSYKLLSAIMTRAVEDKLIAQNPCAIKGAQSATSGKSIACPSTSELDKIVANIHERYKPVVILSACIGLRFSEVSELRVKDVKQTVTNGEKRTTISVSRATTLVEGEFVHGPTKSKASTRVMPVPSFLEPYVEELLAARSKEGPEALLTPAASGANMRNDVFANALNRAKKKAGLEESGISHHSLRHYGGTQYGITGAGLAEVMEWLGDSSPEAALRYLHPTGRALELAEKMPVPQALNTSTS